MAGIMASMISTSLAQTPRDLTAAGAIAALKADTIANPLYNETYNLGPTGLRGWIDLGPRGVDEYGGADGTFTGASRQILVTVATKSANTALAVDDVILGAMAASSGTVPNFSSDCRKALGAAITDAEKTGADTLRDKRWRAGTTTNVNIPMSEDTGAQENAASLVSNIESVQVSHSPSLLSVPKLFVHVRASN